MNFWRKVILIMFTPLNRKEIEQIVSLQFEHINKQLKSNGVELKLTPAALAYLADEGYDPEFGARPVKRVIQRCILNELSKLIIARKVSTEKPIEIDCVNGELTFG